MGIENLLIMKDIEDRKKAYEALRTLMWETDLIRVARESVPVNEALTTLCEYLSK